MTTLQHAPVPEPDSVDPRPPVLANPASEGVHQRHPEVQVHPAVVGTHYAPAPAENISLSGGHLPEWAPAAAGGGAVVAAGVVALTTPLAGLLPTLLLATALFLVTQTAWSLRVEGRRHAVDRLATTAIYATFVMAAVPLMSVLLTVITRGMKVLNWEFLTFSMRNVSPRAVGGGAGHAIVGSLMQVGLAAAVAVPVGVLAAIFLVEYGRGKLSKAISFFVDVMTGIPSIVSGLFVFTALILGLGLPRSGFAASLALAILMLPVVIRSTEEMLRIVPNDLREAAYALGVPKWRTVSFVVLPTALGGIVTGVMLAVARVAGETAPLLLATFLSQSYNFNPFKGPQAALPTFVWDQITTGTPAAVDRAWAGALVLILIVMVVYLAAKALAAKFAPKT